MEPLAREEVMCQPNPSSTFSLGLRLGGRRISTLSRVHVVLQLLPHDLMYSSHKLCWMGPYGPIVPEKLREVE